MFEIFKVHKYNLVYANRSELPQIIKDFIKCLDIRSIQKSQDITMRIKFLIIIL
jgi:hypothetical protein